MFVCYVDEAGCTGALPSSSSAIQPAFVLVGLALPLSEVRPLTSEFLALKRRYFPGAHNSPHLLDGIRVEIKGAELRRSIAVGTRDERRHAIGFLDKLLQLVRTHSGRLFGRIWVKGIGQPFDGTAVYTSSVQYVCRHFQSLLSEVEDDGFVIADSRNKPKNTQVAHSIFTQKFKTGGDPFARVVEMPVFGHSDNHAGLQIADAICSGLLFPMTMQAYCEAPLTNVHVRPDYWRITDRYGQTVKSLQYRSLDPARRKMVGGFTVDDRIGHQSGARLFTTPRSASVAGVG